MRVATLVALALFCGSAPCDEPRSDWRNWHQHPPEPVQSRTSDSSSSSVSSLNRFHLERRGGLYLVWFENPIAGPVEVELRFRGQARNRTWPALPLRIVVQPRQRTLLTQVYPNSDSFALDLQVTPGAPAATASDYHYMLPFDLPRIRVDQGFGGEFSHYDPPNYYALDFALPEGTPVRAARDGTVMQIHSDLAASTVGASVEQPGHFVRILHADGSMALYAHLQEGGTQVREGQRVVAGQPIALSGNTGLSTGPHLHFVVQINRGMRLESVPFRLFDGERELKFPLPPRAPPPS